MRVLVVPDIHLEVDKLEKVIEVGEPQTDATVFLGDFFDSFTKDNNTRRMALWLKKYLHDQSRTRHFIWGNHDLPYAYSRREFMCSGFDSIKKLIIGEVLKQEDWDRFCVCVNVDGVLYSHAGVAADFIVDKESRDDIEAYVSRGHRANLTLHTRDFDSLIYCSSGCTWRRVVDQPLSTRIKQVFGHTPLNTPDRDFSGGLNRLFCIDSYPPLEHPWIVENGNLPGTTLKVS